MKRKITKITSNDRERNGASYQRLSMLRITVSYLYKEGGEEEGRGKEEEGGKREKEGEGEKEEEKKTIMGED